MQTITRCAPNSRIVLVSTHSQSALSGVPVMPLEELRAEFPQIEGHVPVECKNKVVGIDELKAKLCEVCERLPGVVRDDVPPGYDAVLTELSGMAEFIVGREELRGVAERHVESLTDNKLQHMLDCFVCWGRVRVLSSGAIVV